MDKKSDLIPAVAVKSIATGICMMAFFTMLWAGIAYGGLQQTNYWYLLLFYPIFCVVFIIHAVRLFRISKFYPQELSEEDEAEGKKTGKWFGIIFGAEGVGIFIAVNVVVNLGHPDLTIPVIALVVGLHFYPLAKVFKRTIDYYLATWSTIIAVIGIVLTLNKTLPQNEVSAFIGLGLAIATTCYGTYMVVTGHRWEKLRVSPPTP